MRFSMIFPAAAFAFLAACAACEKRSTPPAPPPTAAPPTETLAECLTAKGVKLYSAAWCGPCHRQHEMFGADAAKLDIVECYPDPENPYRESEECRVLGIRAYPTWILPGPLVLEGVYEPELIGRLAGCPL